MAVALMVLCPSIVLGSDNFVRELIMEMNIIKGIGEIKDEVKTK
jgi:hypothetical protein